LEENKVSLSSDVIYTQPVGLESVSSTLTPSIPHQLTHHSSPPLPSFILCPSRFSLPLHPFCIPLPFSIYLPPSSSSPSQDGLTALDLAKKLSTRLLISDTLAARTAAKNVRQGALNVHHVEHIVLQLSCKTLSPPLSCILSQALSPLLSVSFPSPLTLISSLFLPHFLPSSPLPSLPLSPSLPLQAPDGELEAFFEEKESEGDDTVRDDLKDALKCLNDALTETLYNEWKFCRDHPLHCQEELDILTAAIATALRDRQFDDVKALKEQRMALGYVPSYQVNAEEIRMRLMKLYLNLAERYEQLILEEDEDKCEIVDMFQIKIQRILDTNKPRRSEEEEEEDKEEEERVEEVIENEDQITDRAQDTGKGEDEGEVKGEVEGKGEGEAEGDEELTEEEGGSRDELTEEEEEEEEEDNYGDSEKDSLEDAEYEEHEEIMMKDFNGEVEKGSVRNELEVLAVRETMI
jgi:hypothetical protein